MTNDTCKLNDSVRVNDRIFWNRKDYDLTLLVWVRGGKTQISHHRMGINNQSATKLLLIKHPRPLNSYLPGVPKKRLFSFSLRGVLFGAPGFSSN